VRKPGFRTGSSFRVAWSPDSKRLVTLGRRVAVWDVDARKKIGEVKPFSHESSVDVSPSGDRFAVKNTQGTVAVVDLETALVRLVLPGDEYGEGAGVRFSPDGEYVVDGSWNGDLLVRDATTGAIALHERSAAVQVLASTPDRELWAYNCGDTLVLRRWPFDANEPNVFRFERHAFVVADVALVDADRVAIARTGGVETWNFGTEPPEALAHWPTAIAGTGDVVACSADGRFVAHAGGGAATILDDELRVVWHEPFEYPSDVAFSPDGRLLAVGDWSKGVVFPVAGVL
jgi:WD40 repeat protein